MSRNVRVARFSPINVALAGAGAVATVMLLLNQRHFRDLEAEFTSHLVGIFTLGRASHFDTTIWFGIGTNQVAGLSVTFLCSSVILIAPLMVIAALILAVPGFRLRAVITSLLLSLGLAVGTNVLRFGLAAGAYQAYGMGGFDFVHRYGGALMVIFAFMASIILLVVVAIRVSRRYVPAHRKESVS